MKKLYLSGIVCTIILLTTVFSNAALAQSCTLTATYTTTESRCAATGTVQINASGGSGNYVYKVSGPVVSTLTSSSLITGLSAGRYLVYIQDIVTNCIYQQDSVTVPGNYVAPTFTMTANDVTCINGNDGSIVNSGQSFGRGPFTYKIIAPSASSVGATNTTGNFSGLISGNYLVQLTDSCGAIQTRGITIQNYDWLIDHYSVVKVGCNVIFVTINLKDNKGRETPDPVFNNFTYGASVTPGDTTWFTSNSFYYPIGTHHTVSLIVKDGCGNIKRVIWTDPNVPNVNGSIAISNRTCNYFTATITGQVNLTNPEYCIYNAGGLMTCNTTGVFDSLPYGNYCIKIQNNCYDTLITRCFNVVKPVPSIDPWVHISPICSEFDVSVGGLTNLTNPKFCLYDSIGTELSCNDSGYFAHLPFGSYCIKIKNDPDCYDTTIVNCFTVNRPLPTASETVKISDLACSTFTASIQGAYNWNNALYCLFTPQHVLIICNSTGIFENLPYGTYCIDITNGPGCYDTTMSRCFTVNPLIPQVAASVTISNKGCATYTAKITGQINLSNPQYCLYDSLETLINCNTTGTFNNIPYGSYCIRIINDSACYDTTMQRCFTQINTMYLDLGLSAKKSCIGLGKTDIKVTFKNSVPAYLLKLYSPLDTLMQQVTTSSSSYTFMGLPDLAAPLKYKVVATDYCNNKDSDLVAPVISVVKPSLAVTPRCPSSTWANGSADIKVDITNNNVGGSIQPVAIKKNGVDTAIYPNSGIGYLYTFLNLGPGTYVFDTYISDCNLHVYDTVTVRPYIPPGLLRSAAYQCDNNSFSIGALVDGGVGPFLFEIIGSIPGTPSIIAGPQTSPFFTINNGTSYSLIRLRVTDACDNAGLNDVSVLPLANTIITANDTCFYQNILLSVDTIPNATYTWYKRIPVNDSIYIGTGTSLNIPFLLPSDTGSYICKVSVNNGCLTHLANYHLTGFCGVVLARDLHLNGAKLQDAIQLKWTNNFPGNTKEFILERSSSANGGFGMIRKMQVPVSNTTAAWSWTDQSPLKGNNYYRLTHVSHDNKSKYSNIVLVKNGAFSADVYPNPVGNMLYISISSGNSKNYRIELTDMQGKKLQSNTYYNLQNTRIQYPRSASMGKGLYLLNITELSGNEKQTYKLVYQ